MSETFFKRKSASIVKQLSDLKNLLTPEYLNEIDEAGLLVRLELVDRLESNFEVVQSSLEQEDLNEIESNTRALFFENFVDTKTVINRQLNQLHRAVGARQSTTVRQFSLDDPQASIIVTQPKSRLPVLPVPTFSGNYAEWLDFYSMFQTVFHNDNDLTKIEKFQYLKSSLKAPALDTVNSLEINEQNYDLALAMLKKRYDNKRLSFQIHVKNIFALKKVEKGEVSSLRELSDKVSSHLRALNTMGTKEQLADGLLIHLVGQKLDLRSQTKWEEQTPINSIPTWDSMSTFLDKRCQTLENVENATVKETPSKQVSKKPNQTNFSRKVFVASSSTNDKICEFCNSSEHDICNCQSFKNLLPATRYEEAKKKSLCLNCLKKGHLVSKCQSRRCSIYQFKHHTLLHLKPLVELPQNPTKSLQPPVPSQTALISTSHSPTNSRVLENRSENFVFIATAIIFIKNGAGSNIPCRAILDSASQIHCITSRLADQLHLRRKKVTTFISGIGAADLVSNESMELFMCSRVGEFMTSFRAIIVPTITEIQPTYSVNCANWNIPGNIELADPTFFKPQKIDVLIGAGLFYELLCVGQIRLSAGLPLLQKTRLGWIVSGGGQQSLRSSCLVASSNNLTEETLQEDSQLHELVKSFWEVEDCSANITKATKDDIDCEDHFVKNLFRLRSGEYSVRLPFKISPSQLGDSYHQALRRFLNLEKKLQNRPELKGQYSDFMREYEELNHMSILNSFTPGIATYFLPHHCVLKADSSTTKLRVVFDGSAVTSSGKSLNDILFAGPTIQPKLFDILLRFRTFKFALTGDICKMYRCVRVRYPDNHLQCILWREKPTDPIKIFKLDTVTYGTKPAAFLAIRTMHQLALDEETAYPIGSKIIRRDFYVDDLISGGNSTQEVLELMKQTTELLQRGSFKIRKWCSNSSMVLNNVTDIDKETFLKFHDGSDVTKTLGLIWDPNSDHFLFSFVPFLENQRITKRTVLSFIARFYDPLGLIGPVIAKAKIYLQVLWKEKLNWDESLPQSLQSIWTDLCAEFNLVDSFSFPRLALVPGSNLELHAFCDASLLAYGVCIYIRSELNGVVQTSLLCSKSRVSPLKALTVPKLELSAATILADIIHSIFKLNIFQCDYHCWSDSTTVLFWLREEPTNYNVFVANRVCKIQTLTSGMTWHYVPSLMNPADILSKGATPRELMSSSLWQHGPSFLRGLQQQWPLCPALVQDLPEKRKRVLLTTFKVDDYTLQCKYFNSFAKMQRIYAYIYRFTTVKSKPSGPLTINEIQQGTILMLRMVQKVHLSAEYKALQAKKSIDSNSSIYSLNPFLDNCGLLRVGGRLQNSLLDFESKHPIILPKQHPITNSIIDHFHQKFLHAGPQSLLASIRLQYWPIGGRKSTSRVLNKCVRCFRVKPKLAEHIMGSLPLERVQGNRTFLVTGIDFCGPFYYQSEVRNRPPVKCYICLFICFATKAVHLELVKDLSTLSFLASLKRFICTRGKPKTIWSDNGTNFVGAKSELDDLRKLFLNENHIHDVQKQCLEDGIEWQFIPPRSPHFGGLWEVSVKLAKYHFWRSVAHEILNFEELRTLVCQISAIINSRPLCPITENPEDLEVLTPAHFLVGAPFTSIVEPDVTMLNINRLSRWQRVSFLQQVFWKKWSREYLTNLQERNKWRSSSSNIAVGNMVLLKDENLPPLKWPLARVIEVIKGADHVARVAILRTSYGTTRRAIAKICPLPIDNNNAVEPLQSSTGGVCSE